jgi:capsular polysaccharide biosynthesis protein
LLVPNHLPRFATEMLRLLGIRDSQLVVYDFERHAIVAETLLNPTTHHNAVRFSALFPASCRWLADRIEATNGPLFSREPSKKLFLARRGNRPLVNRPEIEDLAAKNGFRIVLPERLPLLEQWKLISSARCLLGEYGSALHSCLFSSAKTVVCALRSDTLFSGFLQSGIGDALGQPTGYIFGNTVEEQRKSFFVRPELVEEFLQMIRTPDAFA